MGMGIRKMKEAAQATEERSDVYVCVCVCVWKRGFRNRQRIESRKSGEALTHLQASADGVPRVKSSSCPQGPLALAPNGVPDRAQVLSSSHVQPYDLGFWRPAAVVEALGICCCCWHCFA